MNADEPRGKRTNTNNNSQELYWIWTALKKRIYRGDLIGTYLYKPWRKGHKGFCNFSEFMLNLKWKKGLNIARIDQNGDFVPSNVILTFHQ